MINKAIKVVAFQCAMCKKIYASRIEAETCCKQEKQKGFLLWKR